jgi:hypothetical protein
MRTCLDVFVFAEFFPKTGKAIPLFTGAAFCGLLTEEIHSLWQNVGLPLQERKDSHIRATRAPA